MQERLIKIDLPRLAARLWRAQNQWFDIPALQKWLADAGYARINGSWFKADAFARPLEPAEIIEQQEREIRDGITFVTRQPPLC